MRNIKYIVVHCTGGTNNQSTQTIRNSWKADGWKNVGYHYLISGNGVEEQLAEESQITNGVAGHNRNSIHVCYKGGWDFKRNRAVDNRTPQQKAKLLERLKLLKAKYPNAQIVGHRDFSPDLDKDGIIESFEWIKVCPSFDAKEEYKNI